MDEVTAQSEMASGALAAVVVAAAAEVVLAAVCRATREAEAEAVLRRAATAATAENLAMMSS